MAIRRDGMEKWSVENGIFVVCPIEYLAEKLGISEEEIEEKLGHVHGLITMEPYSVIKVEKSYLVENDGGIHPKIEMTTEKMLMSDYVLNPVRNLEEDELLFDEFFEGKSLDKKDNSSYINSLTKIHNDYQDLIKNRTDKLLNKE